MTVLILTQISNTLPTTAEKEKLKKEVLDFTYSTQKRKNMLNLISKKFSEDKTEYNKLSEFYGEFWYLKFFNTYHVSNTFYIILQTPVQKNKLINIYGDAWFKKHVNVNQFLNIRTKNKKHFILL